MPDLTTRTEVPTPVVVPPGTVGPDGRVACPAPARGPGQADRGRPLRRRPGVPGRLVRRHDPLDRRARAAARDRARPGLRLGPRRRRHGRRHPGRNVVASIADDQPILVPVGGEIRHQAEPVALLAGARPGDPPRGAPPRPAAHRAAGAGLRPARLDRRVRALRPGQGRRGRRARRRRRRRRGRPTGSATRSSCTSRTTR